MPKGPAEYVARAEKCRQLAAATDDLPLRVQFLSICEGFLEYAKQLERRSPLPHCADARTIEETPDGSILSDTH